MEMDRSVDAVAHGAGQLLAPDGQCQRGAVVHRLQQPAEQLGGDRATSGLDAGEMRLTCTDGVRRGSLSHPGVLARCGEDAGCFIQRDRHASVIPIVVSGQLLEAE